MDIRTYLVLQVYYLHFKAELRTTPKNTCGKYEAGEIMESMLCAGAANKDACQGDSGGNLYDSLLFIIVYFNFIRFELSFFWSL